jgi:aminoglycoside phosphotransferase (APT) family kinase protein
MGGTLNFFKNPPNLSLFKLFLTFILCQNYIYTDLSREILKDLKIIFDKCEFIDGEPESVEVFPDQGGSFINQIYLVTTSKKDRFVLKIENPNWPKEKTQNEVTNLNYISRYTSIPVPKILAYETAIGSSLIGHEYILMTCMKGKPLNHEFDRIYQNPSAYHYVLSQLADYLAQLKKHQFPALGALSSSDSKSLKCPVDFANMGYTNPCTNFAEYATRWVHYYLKEMQHLKVSGHPNAVFFEKYIPMIEKLLLKDFSFLNRFDETFPFSHQDFVMKNILVDNDIVTAVLDWEWSGAAPSEFESKTGCDFLKEPQDYELFNALLEQKGVTNFFEPPNSNRQFFYQLMENLYSLISCYEWREGKLIHSAKFLNQKLEQRRVRNSKNFDMESYVTEICQSLDNVFEILNNNIT